MDKEYMKSYMFSLHEAKISVLTLFRVRLIDKISRQFLSNEIDIDNALELLLKFMTITCPEDFVNSLKKDINSDDEKRKKNILISFLENDGLLLKRVINLDDDMSPLAIIISDNIHYKIKQWECVNKLIEAFPELTEDIINILQNKGAENG